MNLIPKKILLVNSYVFQTTSTKNAFEVLEQKLLQAQELQSKQASEHFRTQEQFQQAIQKKLEEQAEQQLKVYMRL